jgi:hypothetical protein
MIIYLSEAMSDHHREEKPTIVYVLIRELCLNLCIIGKATRSSIGFWSYQFIIRRERETICEDMIHIFIPTHTTIR